MNGTHPYNITAGEALEKSSSTVTFGAAATTSRTGAKSAWGMLLFSAAGTPRWSSAPVAKTCSTLDASSRISQKARIRGVSTAGKKSRGWLAIFPSFGTRGSLVSIYSIQTTRISRTATIQNSKRACDVHRGMPMFLARERRQPDRVSLTKTNVPPNMELGVHSGLISAHEYENQIHLFSLRGKMMTLRE